MVTQLCLALAGLALQVPQWKDVVPTMHEMFGRDPASVFVLLEFLTVFPEELSGNSKIPVSVGFSFPFFLGFVSLWVGVLLDYDLFFLYCCCWIDLSLGVLE